MQSLQARIDSFKKTKRVKRYPSKSSSSIASVKWPHPPDFKANANTLAEAGFYFNPSWHDRDSVACFLCGKELSDWDADDDPFEIHYSKCKGACAWAIVRCGLQDDIDSKGRFAFGNKERLPSTKAMEKARLESFGKDWWPHDEEPVHAATSVKMAQAGFVYTPQAAGDDTVTCLYCNLSLGGWESGDDPLQEHRARSKTRSPCPFLALSEQQSEDELAAVRVSDPPPPRAKRGKARSTTSAASTKPRRKTRATRGKSAKASIPVSQPTPSPSQEASHEDVATDNRASMDVDDSPADASVPQEAISSSLPTSTESQQDTNAMYMSGSMHPLPDVPASPPTPSALSKPDPPPDNLLNHPNLIVTLSPEGQLTIADTQVLTDHERTMSLEQWIRHEIGLSYDQLFTDGQRQIELFKTKAAELRKCIDEL